jgi:hypothetical protein
VDDRHFGQRVSHDQRNDGTGDVGDDDAGTREADRHRAAEEQTHADGAPHGNHRELARVQEPLQPFFGGGGRRQRRGFNAGGSQLVSLSLETTTFNAETAELAEQRGVRLQPDWKKSA